MSRKFGLITAYLYFQKVNGPTLSKDLNPIELNLEIKILNDYIISTSIITITINIMLPNPVIMRNPSPQNPYYYTKYFQ